MPAPAVAGSKVPLVVEVIPVPVHVPPDVTALRLNGEAPTQTGVALEIVASAKSVTLMVTVDDEEAQGELEIVHWKTFAPTLNPVTPDVGDDGVVITPDPLTNVHRPVPVIAVFPARVAVVPQMV